MENKTLSTRWRPRKDFWELKDKLATQAAENKWKFKRGRPKKQRTIDNSINTKISNHQKDVSILEKKNKEIHNNINTITKHTIEKTENLGQTEQEKNNEKYSKIALLFSMAFFIFAILYRYFFSSTNKNNNLTFSNINNSWNIENTISNKELQMQIWFNNESWEFIEIENININNSENIAQWSTDDTINNWKTDNIINSDIALITTFYEKINNREFSELSKITDSYLKSSAPYITYFSDNWLNKFLDKIAGNKIFVWWISEIPSEKPNVKRYWYILKYKLENGSGITEENREIAIVERNWERLIWSIMCVTTWCSKMPFFQK